MRREKAWEQLHKNTTRYIEQIVEATYHKTAAVRPLTPISKTIQIKRTKYAGEVRTNSSATFSCGPLHSDEEALDDQLEHIYNGSVRTQDLV